MLRSKWHRELSVRTTGNNADLQRFIKLHWTVINRNVLPKSPF